MQDRPVRPVRRTEQAPGGTPQAQERPAPTRPARQPEEAPRKAAQERPAPPAQPAQHAEEAPRKAVQERPAPPRPINAPGQDRRPRGGTGPLPVRRAEEPAPATGQALPAAEPPGPPNGPDQAPHAPAHHLHPPANRPPGPPVRPAPPEPPAEYQWLDEEAGPVVRPYALINGRTRSSGPPIDLIAMVVATGERPPSGTVLGPEQEKVLARTRRAASVADVAAELDLAVGVVRVILGDLRDMELIVIRPPAPVATFTGEHILKDVINGLRAL
ncbi:hypothetical protein DP939_01245 [Spongiactinospora rosea]|uniref:DUF742 domain-containing protein n=2 Tax=Spongiactinospora rosea TaxID=2248750 RepID=A0A366M6D4_9ACTN|nr:hypothetical protein DP939_01245 [Spongiactinospora rosea]